MKQFLAKRNVMLTEVDMCAYGMHAEDKQGRGFAQKRTRIMTSSTEVIKRISRKCPGGHRHVHLEQGGTKMGQVYPREFCHALCDGIAAQRKIDSLGVMALPVIRGANESSGQAERWNGGKSRRTPA